MIEAFGAKGMLPSLHQAGTEALARSPKARIGDAGPLPELTASSPIAQFELKGLVADIASKPPVDAAKVSALRGAIASGSYRVDAARIADAMLVSR